MNKKLSVSNIEKELNKIKNNLNNKILNKSKVKNQKIH